MVSVCCYQRVTESPTVEGESADAPGKGYDRTSKRRLAPMLTITLPSTEELHSGPEPRVPTKVAAKPPPSPQTDERHLKASVKSRCHEESLSLMDNVGQHGPRKVLYTLQKILNLIDFQNLLKVYLSK